MGTSRISSDIGVAQSAVSKLTSVTSSTQGKQVEFSGSSLKCMSSAQNLTNDMLKDVEELVETIQTQAHKVTGLAQIIEYRDQTDAQSWGF
ncbi:hypothetical protein [Lactococcus protaetiae]|uniref:Type VII secretion effector n=1 Tax=Lactococcus protaetiae TaxID=2592653 RepID=A0A514ZAH1_9LACT|nr:hypothetical protein [Lactococcus protaetiae]QDK71579.1 hypothetical protein FLP15_10905 [Lactococcus protaetiae]